MFEEKREQTDNKHKWENTLIVSRVIICFATFYHKVTGLCLQKKNEKCVNYDV